VGKPLPAGSTGQRNRGSANGRVLHHSAARNTGRGLVLSPKCKENSQRQCGRTAQVTWYRYIARFRSSLSNFMKQRPSSKAQKVGSLHLIQPKVQSSRSRNSVTGTPSRVGEIRFTSSYRIYFRFILILSSRSCTYFTEDAQCTWHSNYEVGSQWFDSRTNQCASRHSHVHVDSGIPTPSY